tara:strand:+ start:1636 stop:2532 length:897 start_codon:yes stop_codon:yes gene_type:complete
MDKKKYTSKDYISDEKTSSEIQDLNEQKKDLSNFNLDQAQLENIFLVDAKMENCNFSKANLKNASMYGANLKGSNLFKANLENANLKNANLEHVNLLGANLSGTKLENVTWGENYKIINELQAEKAAKDGDLKLSKQKYREAEEIYRSIKISMQSQTLGDETGQFFIREMIAKRKQFNKFSTARIGSKIIELTTGYGEKLSNIVFTVIGIIIACMFLYGIEGISYGDKIVGFFSDDFSPLNTLGNLFYFSVVVYSTVGFGEMLPIGPIGKSVMIFEGIMGGLVLAILIIALYKKTMDR